MARLTTARALGLVLAAVLVAGVLVANLGGGAEPRSLTAHFPRAVSIYPGSEVRILGVTVGSVDDVTPEGDSVRVDMTYDAKYSVPADAQAVIVTPTLVSDRFVQLTPVYTGGEKMADGGDIALPETAVPVELDRIYSALQDLGQTLGPNGLNQDGTLDNLLRAGSRAFKGQGGRANQMIRDLADASSAFANSSGPLFATVSNLAEFTSTLAANDRLVRAFFADLTDVSSQLSGERVELQRTVASLADAVGVVERFVKGNRTSLVRTVEKLTRVTSTIDSQRDSLDTVLKIAPVALGNLSLGTNVESQSVNSRINVGPNPFDADGFLCAAVQRSAIPQVSKDLACKVLETLLEPVEGQLPYLPPGTESNDLPDLPELPGLSGASGGAAGGADAPAPGLDGLLGGGS